MRREGLSHVERAAHGALTLGRYTVVLGFYAAGTGEPVLGLSKESCLAWLSAVALKGDSSQAWWEGCREGLEAGTPSGGLEVTKARSSSHEMGKKALSPLKERPHS